MSEFLENLKREAEQNPDMSLAVAAGLLTAKAEVRLRGTAGRARGLTRKRTLRLDKEAGTAAIRWRRLRTGRYTVKVAYLGDQWRTASRARTRTLTLKARHCRKRKR